MNQNRLELPAPLQVGVQADLINLEAPPRFEPGNKGFADPCLTTWLWRHTAETRNWIREAFLQDLFHPVSCTALCLERDTRFGLATFTLAR